MPSPRSPTSPPRVEPGRVTGFLGPNGAGKTTTLRILLGLVRPTSGTATIGGAPYATLSHPLQTVGAVLEASSFHPGRTAANHLKVYAQAAGLPGRRVEEALGLVGLADVAGRKVGGFSLGMRQRLGLAYALLGDPGVLVLDEPANGLDPEGIKWMRGFLRQLAREGRTVLVSSHLLAEVQQTVDSLLIISQGRLVFQGALEELADPSEYATVVDSPDRAALAAALRSADAPFEVLRSGLTVRGLDPAAVGAVAAAAGVALSSLQRRGPALEEVFLDLVNGVRVHPTAAGAGLGAAVRCGRARRRRTGGCRGDARRPRGGCRDPGDRRGGSAGRRSRCRLDPPRPVGGRSHGRLRGYGRGGRERARRCGRRGRRCTRVGGRRARPGAREVAPDAEVESDAEPPVEAAIDPSPAATFAVASTGVIDIVPFTAGDPQTDAYQDDLPLDEDPDVEALGAIDEELSTPDLPADPEEPVSGDRPWEDYVKTDADVEADAFFASFTAKEAAEAEAAEAADAEAAAADADAAGARRRRWRAPSPRMPGRGLRARPRLTPSPSRTSERDLHRHEADQPAAEPEPNPRTRVRGDDPSPRGRASPNQRTNPPQSRPKTRANSAPWPTSPRTGSSTSPCLPRRRRG